MFCVSAAKEKGGGQSISSLAILQKRQMANFQPENQDDGAIHIHPT
jgi:hypothetical protein